MGITKSVHIDYEEKNLVQSCCFDAKNVQIARNVLYIIFDDWWMKDFENVEKQYKLK